MVCALLGFPGPKLTAGTPMAANLATSVQPNLALGSAPTACTKAAAAGWSRPGRAPGAGHGAHRALAAAFKLCRR